MSFVLLERPRTAMARRVRERIAGPDFERVHHRIWDQPGPRWFGEPDPIWVVHNDTAMFVGGIRALLLQSLHPVAMAAVSEHSGFRGDPWGRLHRISHFLATTTYGTIADAERSITAVRAVHRQVRGTYAGRPYRADEPELLAWVHAAEVDSFLAAHRAFGAIRLSAAEADRYVAQTGLVARRLGVPEPPDSTGELAAVLAGYRPGLASTPAAREAAQLLLRDPPLEGASRAGYRLLAAGAVSLLPPWARAELGLLTLPLTDRLVSRPLARTALQTLRWALSG